ncbi:hypothetical protein [Desertibacillus haloalkaliphilus]|uniref:hypothetical protein n=1 Tax=Desertibacillus haloalkaliphilus TaxID=1328930 RepID=UPI001C26799F|nr:hypothetical protein [Desertibacillus haloalkaliphilus]MBU8908110.1 hypothetical protein [Desertibacillus haloalkaliphilus]
MIKSIFQKIMPERRSDDIEDRVDSSLYNMMFSYIKEEWEKIGAKVSIVNCMSFDELKSLPKQVSKDEIQIAILFWKSKGVDIVNVTRHTCSLEYPLNGRFTELDIDQLKIMKVLPVKSNCIRCSEFSTNINIDDLCEGCVELSELEINNHKDFISGGQ